MKCNQCGKHIPVSSGRYCPFCEGTFEDEVRDAARRAHPISRRLVTLAVVLTVVALVAAVVGVWLSRHYEWTETITSPVASKDYYQTSHLECATYTTSTWYDDDGYPHTTTSCLYYETVYDDHFVLVLNDTHREEVSAPAWTSFEVGQNFTYQVRHWDWKPGMENAPTPTWVWFAPVAAGAGIAGAYVVSRIVRRWAEVSEWKKTGDLNVEEED